MIYKTYIKRGIDIVFSLLAIVALSPLLLLVAAVVRVQMGKPILFSQERIGKDEKIFRLYKFRSMTNAVDAQGRLLPDKLRLTKFGVLLRSSSLDELPELFMILKGDMSFVGPRPQPKRCGPFYTPQERRAHTVRGGLVPPDCLSRRVQCDWDTQLRHEADYADNCSFLLDMKILLCSVVVLHKRLHCNYGVDNRPELYEYRANMEIPEAVKKEWEAKGVTVE